MNIKKVLETAPSWATAIGKSKHGIHVWMNSEGYSYFHNPDTFFRYFTEGASASSFTVLHTIKSFVKRIDDKVEEMKAKEAKQYDNEEKEISMGKCVEAFNIITGKDLTESEGWLLLQLLKDVRQWSKESYHEDSTLNKARFSFE